MKLRFSLLLLSFLTPPIAFADTSSTTTTLTADPPAGTYGGDIHLTATVTSSGGDTPTGPIHFTLDDTVVFPDPHAPSATIYAGSRLTPGTHSFVAEFLGDTTHAPSRATLTYAVSRQAPGIGAVPSFAVANALDKGFDVDVDALLGGGNPKGTLTIHFDDVDLGTRSIDLETHQHYFFPLGSAGRHTLRATYNGDALFAAVDTALPFVIFPATPLSVDARGTSRGVVLTWNHADPYGFGRKRPGQDWATGCCMLAPWLDDTVPRETVFLYRASSADGTVVSAADVAMIFTFTDDPLLPEKNATALHVNEVVRATNLLRSAAGLFPVTLSSAGVHRRAFGAGSVPSSAVIQLRAAINEARENLGAFRFEFIAPVAANTPMNGAQLQELREAVR